jgi:hypothetical protein
VGPGTSRQALPGQLRQADRDRVCAYLASRSGDWVAARHGQHIADTAAFGLIAQAGIGAVDLIRGNLGAGTPPSIAQIIICWASKLVS